MFRLKSIFTALAFIVATPLALPTLATAQTNVIVIDRAQIFAQSKAGQDVVTKVRGIETTMQTELQPTANQLGTEGQALQILLGYFFRWRSTSTDLTKHFGRSTTLAEYGVLTWNWAAACSFDRMVIVG